MFESLKRVKAVLALNQVLSNASKNWVRTFQDRDSELEASTIVIPEEQIRIDLSNYHTSAGAYWLDFSSFTSKSCFAIPLSKATLISKGILVDQSGQMRLESTIFQEEYLQALKSNHWVVLRQFLPRKRVSHAISLLNALDNNYFHWTLEALTRVYVYTLSNDATKVPWIVKKDPLPFVKQSLQFLFDIPSDHIFEKKLMTRWDLAKTCLISFPHIRNRQTQFTNVYYPKVIRGLNQLALNRLESVDLSKKEWPKRILISRKGANRRRIENETEVVNALSNLDFKAVKLETLAFWEQVALFSQAEQVIALHGAGLTNLLYATKARVVELFPEERNIRDAFYFAQLTAALSLEHHLLLVKAANKKQDVRLSTDQIQQIRSIVTKK